MYTCQAFKLLPHERGESILKGKEYCFNCTTKEIAQPGVEPMVFPSRLILSWFSLPDSYRLGEYLIA